LTFCLLIDEIMETTEFIGYPLVNHAVVMMPGVESVTHAGDCFSGGLRARCDWEHRGCGGRDTGLNKFAAG
jgi:hypothetical protein